MAWVRIHDGAMGNLKILRLTDSAFRLWVRGLCYCQTHLTDGLIPREALREMGAKRKDVDMLNQPQVDGKAPLWETHDIGFKAHDYLAWNDCREVVVDRQTKAKERKEAWQVKQRAEREQKRNAVPNAVPNTLAAITQPNQTEPKKSKEQKDSPPKGPADPRVREFLVWFTEEYKTRRFGAEYLVSWPKHTAIVRRLLKGSSLERMQNCARILLSEKTEDDYIVNSDRGIEVFSGKYNWLSERLARFEASRKVGAA